eukprot:NODE_531_length_6400_cov_1.506904.p2 type:complete len:542 gc:universal NODE_531_length_6400_cov_1.506904:5772-4147(-)
MKPGVQIWNTNSQSREKTLCGTHIFTDFILSVNRFNLLILATTAGILWNHLTIIFNQFQNVNTNYIVKTTSITVVYCTTHMITQLNPCISNKVIFLFSLSFSFFLLKKQILFFRKNKSSRISEINQLKAKIEVLTVLYKIIIYHSRNTDPHAIIPITSQDNKKDANLLAFLSRAVSLIKLSINISFKIYMQLKSSENMSTCYTKHKSLQYYRNELQSPILKHKCLACITINTIYSTSSSFNNMSNFRNILEFQKGIVELQTMLNPYSTGKYLVLLKYLQQQSQFAEEFIVKCGNQEPISSIMKKQFVLVSCSHGPTISHNKSNNKIPFFSPCTGPSRITSAHLAAHLDNVLKNHLNESFYEIKNHILEFHSTESDYPNTTPVLLTFNHDVIDFELDFSNLRSFKTSITNSPCKDLRDYDSPDLTNMLLRRFKEETNIYLELFRCGNGNSDIGKKLRNKILSKSSFGYAFTSNFKNSNFVLVASTSLISTTIINLATEYGYTSCQNNEINLYLKEAIGPSTFKDKENGIYLEAVTNTSSKDE